MRSAPPHFTLTGISNQTLDFDSGAFETANVAITTENIGLENMQMWRYVATEEIPACPDIPVWQQQSLAGRKPTLQGVAAIANCAVWAVGNNGLIRYYDGLGWDTLDWNAQKITVTSDLYGLAALDETHVWAVGGPMGLVYFFDGTHWVWESDPSDSAAAWRTFYGVAALDETHVWAVTNEGEVWLFDGLNWKRDQVFAGSANLFGVHSLDSQNVWLVGADGVIYYYGLEAICSQTWQVSRDAHEDIPRPAELSVKAWGEWAIPQEWQVGDGWGCSAMGGCTSDGGASARCSCDY